MQKKDTSEKYFHSKYFEVFYPKENKTWTKYSAQNIPQFGTTDCGFEILQ